MDVIPQYSRIASLTRHKIVSGQFSAGDKLPSEDDLVRQFKVSKITIRKAHSILQQEGLLIRTQGKGTFVAENIPSIKPISFSSIEDIIAWVENSKVKPLCKKQISVEKRTIDSDKRAFLNITDKGEFILVQRLVFMGSIKVGFFENFLPVSMGKSLDFKKLSKSSLVGAIKAKLNLKNIQASMSIEAVPANVDVANIMQCQPFDPMILIKLHYSTSSGDPISASNCYIKMGYFKYEFGPIIFT